MATITQLAHRVEELEQAVARLEAAQHDADSVLSPEDLNAIHAGRADLRAGRTKTLSELRRIHGW